MHEGDRESLSQIKNSMVKSNKTENNRLLEETKDAYSEIADIFPALKKYKDQHNADNLQKLCAEISEFCRSVYASTQNDKERSVYRAMIEKLNK